MKLTSVRVVHNTGTPKEHTEIAFVDLDRLSYVGTVPRTCREKEGDDAVKVVAYPVTLGPHDFWIVEGPWLEQAGVLTRSRPRLPRLLLSHAGIRNARAWMAVLLVCLLTGAPLAAQSSKKTTKKVPTKADAPSAQPPLTPAPPPDTSAAAPDAPPVMTNLERAKLDLIQLRTAYAQLLTQYDGCKAEVGATYTTLAQFHAKAANGELAQERQDLKDLVEKDHEGWTWDPLTQTFTKKPAPVKKDPSK